MQRLVPAFLGPIGGELLIAGFFSGVRIERVIAGRQPIAAMRDRRDAAVRAGLKDGAGIAFWC